MGRNKIKEEAKYWDEFADLQILLFDRLSKRHREITDLIDKLKKEKEDIAEDLESALLIAGQKQLRVDDLIVVQANGNTASTLSAQRLLEAGVSADTIALCTIPGRSYTYVQVRRQGDNETSAAH